MFDPPGRNPPPCPPARAASTRATILHTVHADEGITKSELADRLGLGWGTVCYHLALLERGGLVRTLRRGRTTHVFPRPRSRRHMEEAAVRRRPAVQRILDLLRRRPVLTVPAIMEQGISRYVAKSCLADMVRAGLVVRVGTGHARYQAPAAVGTSSPRGPGGAWGGRGNLPPGGREGVPGGAPAGGPSAFRSRQQPLR